MQCELHCFDHYTAPQAELKSFLGSILHGFPSVVLNDAGQRRWEQAILLPASYTSMATRSYLLQLPLEIRIFIYELLYSPPYNLGSPNVYRQLLGARSNSRSRTLTKCLRYSCHLSMTLVCRQIYQEYFPIYAAKHTFSISHSHELVEDYLPFAPSHHLQALQHLRIGWYGWMKWDVCRPAQGRQRHTIITDDLSINADLHRLVAAWSKFPQLAENFKTLEFELPFLQSEAPKSPKRSKCSTLIRNTVLLLEEINEVCRSAARGQRFFIIEPSWARYEFLSVKIWAVSRKIWNGIPEGMLPNQHRLQICPDLECRRTTKRGLHWHEMDWAHPSEILIEGNTTTLETTPTTVTAAARGEDVSSLKNWKVVFRPNQPGGPQGGGFDFPTYWHSAMESLDVERSKAYEFIEYEKKFEARANLRELKPITKRKHHDMNKFEEQFATKLVMINHAYTKRVRKCAWPQQAVS